MDWNIHMYCWLPTLASEGLTQTRPMALDKKSVDKNIKRLLMARKSGKNRVGLSPLRCLYSLITVQVYYKWVFIYKNLSVNGSNHLPKFNTIYAISTCN